MMERMQNHLSYITKYADMAYKSLNRNGDKLDGVREVLVVTVLFYTNTDVG
jgi:hypothetical protein